MFLNSLMVVSLRFSYRALLASYSPSTDSKTSFPKSIDSLMLSKCSDIAERFVSVVKEKNDIHGRYIPLISRVRGPYGKLWTEFFPSFYGPSAKRASHENKEGKNEDP